MSHPVSLLDLTGVECPVCRGVGRRRDYYDSAAETMGRYVPDRPCSTCNGHGMVWVMRQPKEPRTSA